MLDENDPLALALFHARLLVKKLETAEMHRILRLHDVADDDLSATPIAYHAFKISAYAKESREEVR